MGFREVLHSQRDSTIEITDGQLREAGEKRVPATYEDWQSGEEKKDGRLSTVVLRRTPEASIGLRWLHVEETWLTESEEAILAGGSVSCSAWQAFFTQRASGRTLERRSEAGGSDVMSGAAHVSSEARSTEGTPDTCHFSWQSRLPAPGPWWGSGRVFESAHNL